ncbi:hypothetical protein [Paeniglutamicibacter antarcticus]|uniref:hypothetical protein n=1 Tax=Paeniglutamicibacter antarcticus TaxID=494023 RepID=UPI001AE8CF59
MGLQTADASVTDGMMLHIGEGAVPLGQQVLQSHGHDFGKIVDHRSPIAVVGRRR